MAVVVVVVVNKIVGMLLLMMMVNDHQQIHVHLVRSMQLIFSYYSFSRVFEVVFEDHH